MAKYPIPENTVDPEDPSNHNIPLWVVHGWECFPSLLACTIKRDLVGKPNVWGLSIWRRNLSYRTLGISIERFYEDHPSRIFYWFNDHEAALDYLRKLTTPPKR